MDTNIRKYLDSHASFDPGLFKFGIGVVYEYFYDKDCYRIHHKDNPTVLAVSLGASGYLDIASKDPIKPGTAVLYIHSPQYDKAVIISELPSTTRASENEAASTQALQKFPSTDELLTKTPELVSNVSLAKGTLIRNGNSAISWNRSSALGSLLELGLDYVIARASASAGIEAAEDTVHLFGEQVHISSLSTAWQEFKNGLGQDTVKHIYKSIYEAQGYPDVESFNEALETEANSEIGIDDTVVDRETIPLVTYYEGESAEGQTRVVRAYIEEDEDYEDKVTGRTLKTHKLVPVFKEVLYKDGSYRIQSATEISIEKYSIITDPAIRREVSEDEAPTDRKYSLDLQSTTYAAQNATLNFSYHAYLFGKLYTEKYAKNWKGRTAADLKNILGLETAIINTPDFRQIPKYAELVLDLQEDTKRRIYGSRSGIFFQDDGSVIIEDGWGSQIVMSKGDITITPANNLIARPGANVKAFIPGELDINAVKGAAVSSDEGALSLSAYSSILVKQFSEDGGILVESSSTNDIPNKDGSPAGVIIKSAGLLNTMADTSVSKANTNIVRATNLELTGLAIDQKSDGLTGSKMAIRFDEISGYTAPALIDQQILTTAPSFKFDSKQFLINNQVKINGDISAVQGRNYFTSILMEGNLSIVGGIKALSEVSILDSAIEIQGITSRINAEKERITTAIDSNTKAQNNLINSTYKTPDGAKGYISSTAEEDLKYVPATVSKVEIQYFETRWQQYFKDLKFDWSVASDEELRGSSPMLTSKAKIYIINDTNIDENGVYKEELTLPSQDNIEELDVVGNYVITAKPEDYKTTPYED